MSQKKILLLLSLFGMFISTYAQEVDVAVSQSNPQRVKADSLLDKLQFTQALEVYSELIKEYPRDPNIQYPLGICYLMGTRNVGKAIEYLTEASTGDVPNMVYFFLAEAHRHNYQFNEAIDYYRRFTIRGASRDISTKDVEPLVAICENGNYLTRYIFTPQVVDSKSLPATDFLNYYSIAPASGNFIALPDNLLSPTDKKMNHQSVMFYPKNPKVGDYVYYSSYGKSTSFGKDIFRIKYQDDGCWSEPEVIGDVVNSFFDDDYPYLAPDGVTLYFSSKGHYGMGGYDIYKSVYNPKTRLWGAAENLGFPYNSPYDDYLYVVGDNDSLVCFATNRNFMSDTVQLVLMKSEANPVRRTPKSVDELISLASLNTKGAHYIADKQNSAVSKTVEREKIADLKKKKSASFSSVESDPEYARVMAKGFAAQMRTDSLIVRLEKLREGFDYIDTAEERIKLEKKVTRVEDDMLAAQKEADMMFVRASQIEQEYLTGKRKPKGKTDATFAVDNPDYIYQAQFANTVFQTDEIDSLAQVEKLYPAMVKAREKAYASRDSYRACLRDVPDSVEANCDSHYNTMLADMAVYTATTNKYFEKKFRIYDDCIHVAIVKSGTTDDGVRANINSAKSNIRTASTIINNAVDEGKAESEFEASLMRELSLLKFDMAFAKIWGLKLYEQQVASRVIKLENTMFGSSQQQNSMIAHAVDSTEAPKLQEPRIEKRDDVPLATSIPIKVAVPSDFGVVDKPVYTSTNPIPIDESLPAGVVYRVQIGAFSTPRDPKFFKGMVPVSGIRVGKVVKYYIGNLSHYADAESALNTIKSKGFKDAFVVAWYNGKPITPQRAQSLEGSDESAAAPEEADLGRLYQIQLGAYDAELPDSVAKTVRTIAVGKEISRMDNGLGQKVFMLGNYTSLNEAQRVKDNLVASGIVNSVVVAVELDKK